MFASSSQFIRRGTRVNLRKSNNALKCYPLFSRSTAFFFSDGSSTGPGLFSIPGLHNPEDFLRLAKQAIDKSNVLRDGIPATISSHAQAVETLYHLDEISKTVCNVIDAAELCRSAHASTQWRDVANQTFQELQQYIAILNADQRLYESLAIIDRDYSADLTEEETRFCFLLKREFELDGIHLPDDQRSHVQTLHENIVNLETLWMSNITHLQKKFWSDSALVESVLPKATLQANGAAYSLDHPGKVQITADSPIAHSISSFCQNGSLRKQVYWESMTNTPENLDVLDSLIHQRHLLATALGFPDFATRSLQDKMAQNPRNVVSFLDDLERQIQPQFRTDLELMGRAKQQVEGSSHIEPWDLKFYTKLVKAQFGVDPNELAPFLGLDNCVRAMQFLVDRLFGIAMKEEALADGEGWDIPDGLIASEVPPAERIRKFVFSDQTTQQGLGTMYLDLQPRPGKYTHAAHFTVKCGCRVSGPESDFQLPVVALVCNMSSGGSTLTSHSEVETLFHEMGHALHSLLSRTNFQHMAGTRAAMDFVETPSHWMEHFVWEPQFLKILCQHVGTGEVLPDRTIQSLVQSRNILQCIELQNQIVLSKFDQQIFSGPAVQGQPQQIWTDLHKKYRVPFMPDTHWYTNVGHLVTYGAGYYGYLYSQVFASAIWKELFEKRPLDRKSGQSIWKGMLMHGGARDAQLMLTDLLGHEPTVANYWSRINKP